MTNILTAASEGGTLLGTFGGGVSLVLGLFALVALVCALVAFARVSLTKSTVEVLSESNRALTERLDIMESEKTRQDAEMTIMKAKLVKVEGENATLRSLVTGTEAIQRLGELVLQETQTRQREHHDILASIQTTAEVIVALLQELKHLAHSHDKGS